MFKSLIPQPKDPGRFLMVSLKNFIVHRVNSYTNVVKNNTKLGNRNLRKTKTETVVRINNHVILYDPSRPCKVQILDFSQ